jgi:hypothetical protein
MRVEAWRTTAGPITGVTGYTYCTLPLRVGQGADEPVEAILVDRETFAVLGVAPAFGRLPSADEVRSGAPVAVLRHKTWISRFGGDAHVVGRTFDLGDATYTVIGVMPPGFFFPTEQGGDLWVPVTSEARSWPSFYALARLAPGASVEEASDFLERVARRLGEEEPPEAALGARAVLHLDNVVSNVKGGIELLFGTALLVVLVACVNLGNLFLGRAAGRREELLSTASSPDATTGRLTFTTPASSSPSTGSSSRTSFSVACSGTSATTDYSTNSTPSPCSPGRDPVGSASTLPCASSVTIVPASSASCATVPARPSPSSASTPSPALPPGLSRRVPAVSVSQTRAPTEGGPDGRTEIVLSPLQLLERLVALPLASASRDEPPRPASSARIRWSLLLARIYEVLPVLCPACGGSMKILAFLTDPPVVSAILLHLDLPHRPPPLAPARDPPQRAFLIDQTPSFDPTEPEPAPDVQFDQSQPHDFND